MAIDSTPTRLTQDEIVALSKRHSLYEWSAQNAVDPIPVARAEGVYFYSPDGTRYLDFNSQLINNYGYNSRLSTRSMSEVQTPAGVIAIGDSVHWIGELYNGYCYAYAAPSGWPGNFETTPAIRLEIHTRHNFGSILAFADGHAKWMQTTTIEGNRLSLITP